MFKTFPEFSKLTLNDRAEYEAFIKDFPPIADLSFASLMTWWNSLGQMAISQLNGNLVISYWMPGFESDSGLSLIGAKRVDESFCTLLDYLKERGERPRLVNVPAFVVENVQYPGLFAFKEQRSYNDYILAVSKYYPLDNMVGWRRRKVQSQLGKLKGSLMEVKSLDMSNQAHKNLLEGEAEKWSGKNVNNFGLVEKESMTIALQHSQALGIENLCLFIEGRLRGFCLFQRPHDKAYAIVNHIKATGNKMLGYELITYLFAKWLADQGIDYININSDVGIMRLRMFMLTLGPINFFRKYCVEPA
jgi:hypothetical protein